MKKILILGITLLILVGCGKNKSKLDQILESNNYIIVDVRTNEEFNGMLRFI